ncbi:MAG: tetratricopeptide repeat protein [Chitinispirillaceae bacterium]|nr:tetratricopeptide repeat protein [Chitinispirillaceae bacterium]
MKKHSFLTKRRRCLKLEKVKHCRASPRLLTTAGISLFTVFSLLFISCVSDSRSIEKGEASLRLGDYSMAIRFFDEVLHRNPENFEARLGMGRALIQQASLKNADSTLWGKALTHLEAARTIRPESDIDTLLSEAWLVNARRLLNRCDTINALNSISRAIDLGPRSIEALNLAGIIYFRIGEPDKARILFDRALVADTSRPFTHFNIGMVRWAVHDIRGARDAWFRALQLAPTDKDIVYWYSMAEKKLKESEQ